MVMGAEEDCPEEGCHSSWVGRTERVPLSFLYDASTDGVEVVMSLQVIVCGGQMEGSAVVFVFHETLHAAHLNPMPPYKFLTIPTPVIVGTSLHIKIIHMWERISEIIILPHPTEISFFNRLNNAILTTPHYYSFPFSFRGRGFTPLFRNCFI
jgi:hypothetical protein